MFISKKRKILYAIFIVLLLSLVLAPLVCYAVDPEHMDPEVYKYIKVRSKISNVIRSCMWTVLTFLARIIDYIDSAIDEVLSINLYEIVIDYLPQSTVMDIAWVIFSLSLVIAGIILIVNADKIKIQDFFRNILISVCFLVAFPSLMSVLSGFQGISESTADMITTGGETEIVHSLGEDLLADNLVFLPSCMVDGEIHYFSETSNYSTSSIYSININGIMSQDTCDFKYESSESTTNQKVYSELTTENKMKLLRLGDKYQYYLNCQDNPSGHMSESVPLEINAGTNPIFVDIWFCVTDHSKNPTSSDAADPVTEYDPAKYPDTYYCPVCEDNVAGTYEDYLIDQIAENYYVEQAGLSADVRSSRTVETALDVIEDIIRELNIKNNQNMVESGTDQTFRAYISPLRTQEEYDDLAWYEKLPIDILEGYSEELVYGYGFDFIFTVISLLISGICLVFALFKLCRMLYEIVFMRIAVPLFIAADANGSGKGKKALLQLINTFIVLLAILILLRIYISSISWIHTNVDNFVAEWALIITGMFFVIDGPDFIVKMTGLDAGVKSGAATLMSLKSGMDIAKNTAGAPLRAMRSVSNAAEKAGGMAAGFKDSMAQDGIANKAKALVGNTGIGQAFRRGANSQYNNNAAYNANTDAFNSSEGSAAAAPSENETPNTSGSQGSSASSDNAQSTASSPDVQRQASTGTDTAAAASHTQASDAPGDNNRTAAADAPKTVRTENGTYTSGKNSKKQNPTAEAPQDNPRAVNNANAAAPTSKSTQTAAAPSGTASSYRSGEPTGHSNTATDPAGHDNADNYYSPEKGHAFENVSAPAPQQSDSLQPQNSFANAEIEREQNSLSYVDELKKEEDKS